MILATYSGALVVGIGLVATILAIIAGAAVWSVFRGSRSQNLSEAQATALDALEKELNAYKARCDRLEAEDRRKTDKLKHQDERLSAQQGQINALQEMVTQTAKVDDLTFLVKNGFKELGVSDSILNLIRRRPNGN